ncbi:hypothetical protein JH06_0903 [Blastocystis sp. subtype 4]|uniref:hypothetical protein n=1 Tax=Blastocystis sp. subtype 4 TaxID=944170 RepID=UPI0007114F9F|nr:hypothetical protein JH06_0903 [Blastocystis sp. subtype 4]KNB45639.1 hypothetical protein JH06_0903 [Blastocystis sp. subtype 4]|eukprot:XP_014529081.1 hypothetical protein JH06_0903 [Blastocystis sp. subtype 4]
MVLVLEGIICNSINGAIRDRGAEVDISSHSHIINSSIKLNQSASRTFSPPNMQVHSSPSKNLLKSGASQSSVKSLFAKAPSKKKESSLVVEKEVVKESVSVKKSTVAKETTTAEEDLFDEEESDDDVIAVVVIWGKRNRIRQLQLYADSEEEETPKEEIENSREMVDSQESQERTKSKKRSEPVNGAMDFFAKKVQKETPEHPGKRLKKKLREVPGEDGFSYLEEYYEEEDVPEEIPVETPVVKPKSPVKKAKQTSIASFFSKK